MLGSATITKRFVMKVKVNLANQNANLLQGSNTQDYDVFRQPVMNWSDEAAWNYREEVIIRPGLNLNITNIKNPQTSYHFDIDQSPMEMGIVLTGQTSCHLRGENGLRKSFIVNSGTNQIIFSPKSTGIQEIASQPIVYVGIYIDPEILHDYLGHQDDCLPKAFKDILSGKTLTSFFQTIELTDNLRNVALQVLSCPFKGVARKLFLESKALEILALQTGQLGCLSKPAVSDPVISKRDIERVQEVRDILVRFFQTPPSLFDLSKSAGISHTKLNRDFRKVYGKTVFDYLRQVRLDYARLLLLDTQLTITEIAFDSGFSDSSHFSRLFSQAFGFRPSIYRKKDFSIS